MRFPVALFLSCLLLAGATAQNKDKSGKRYLIAPNLELYPQDTPENALASVIKAIENKKTDYLLAQLTDPEFVDRQVQRHAEALKPDKGGEKLKDLAAFDEFVKAVATHLTEDPTLLKDLKRIAKGDWERGDNAASASTKENKDKHAFFRKVGNRWYFENRQKEKPKS
jgi:hypothetical protein